MSVRSSRSRRPLMWSGRSVYFYFGASAYPDGDVALLCQNRIAGALPTSFWPFDTGGVSKGHLRIPSANPWSSEEQKCCLLEYWGSGATLVEYMAEYLAAHFLEPIDYVRCAQSSDPDHRAYHGLDSTNGDRRAWTVEVQVHDRIGLAPAQGVVQGIILQRHKLLAEQAEQAFALLPELEEERLALLVMAYAKNDRHVRAEGYLQMPENSKGREFRVRVEGHRDELERQFTGSADPASRRLTGALRRTRFWRDAREHLRGGLSGIGQEKAA